jgi:hypothetical protein
MAAQRVLFIGNSYTFFNDMPGMVAELARAAGFAPIVPTLVAPGGWTLEKHWQDGGALARLREGGWSHVVLQEQSTRPIENPQLTLEFGRRFGEEINRVGAQPVAYHTWARRNRPQTQDALDATYHQLAQEIGGVVAPAGPVWRRLLEERPDLALHLEDQSHPTPLGSYAAAAVLFAAITRHDPVPLGVLDVTATDGATRSPVTLDADAAQLVRRIASEETRHLRDTGNA